MYIKSNDITSMELYDALLVNYEMKKLVSRSNKHLLSILHILLQLCFDNVYN